MKVAVIVGARPQIIKVAPVIWKLREKGGISYFILHTGQHYDFKMSKVFFGELNIPEPHVNLGVGSGSHGEQTGDMLMGIEQELIKVKPDLTIVPGDTNSTLAGALASVKLKIPVAHLEAGLRSFDFYMPEEINRRLTDACSELLFAPTQTAVLNLLREGVSKERIHRTGDTMYDVLVHSLKVIKRKEFPYEEFHLAANEKYCVLTLHRAENVDSREKLASILSAIPRIKAKIIFPVHPRTRKNLVLFKLMDFVEKTDNLVLIEPVGYLDFISLILRSELVLTDSGGVQKEAFLIRKPCITLRDKTEWIETVRLGGNILVGVDTEKIVAEANKTLSYGREVRWDKNPFGDGKAAERIYNIILNHFAK